VRLLEREFESAVKDDIPFVIDLLTRAQFYLLVLDEDPTERPSVRAPGRRQADVRGGASTPHGGARLSLRF